MVGKDTIITHTLKSTPPDSMKHYNTTVHAHLYTESLTFKLNGAIELHKIFSAMRACGGRS